MLRNVLLIYNSLSGFFVSQQPQKTEEYFSAFFDNDSKLSVQLLSFNDSELAGIKAIIQKCLPEAVWVAGGDGTILSIAGITAELQIPIGILPGGTMNLLARDLGMDQTMETALHQLKHAQPECIDMAEVNGRPFLCISNIGISTRLTERREHLRHYSGWIRWPLLIGNLFKLLFDYPVMTIKLEIGNQTHRLRTRSVSISNNPLASDSTLIPVRNAINKGFLGIYVAQDASLWSLPRLILKLIAGNWHGDDDLLRFEASQASITCRRKRQLQVMSDGELHRLPVPLKYRIKPGRLTILKPESAQ
jgi:diacylglycerol kinase family enzyme